MIDVMKEAVGAAKVGNREKMHALRRMAQFFGV
jgi:hypothetical protein